MPSLSFEQALPEPGACRRGFDRAARSFASASFAHDTARRRLLERFDGLKTDNGIYVDLGSALGQSALALAGRFPDATIVAVDTSLEMLRRSGAGTVGRIAGDARRLPFADGSIALLFANMVLPWVHPEAFFAEARRVLSARGLLMFSTLGPESLAEIRRAWSAADEAIHVHAFPDMQMLGDIAARSGLEEPVLDVDRVRISYSELSSVIRDLRACGATNTAGGRRRGLTGRRRWQRFVEALWREQGAGDRGRMSLTLEFVYGQAFGARRRARVGGATEIVVPISELGRKPI